MKFFLLIISFCFCSLVATAQKKLMHDTSSVATRDFSSAEMSKYARDKNFQYETVNEPRTPVLTTIWLWIVEKINKLFSTKEGSTIARIVFIVLAVALLVFCVLKFTGMTKLSLFGKKNRDDGLAYQSLNEDIHSIDFNEMIQQAIDQRNFRLALRLMYLQTLKQLTDRGLIAWQINKTNIDYLRELKDSMYSGSFDELTWQFESHWYGDIPIGETEFSAVRQRFDHFNKTLPS